MVYRCEIVVVIVHTIYIHTVCKQKKTPVLYIEASLNQQRFVNIKNIFMSEKIGWYETKCILNWLSNYLLILRETTRQKTTNILIRWRIFYYKCKVCAWKAVLKWKQVWCLILKHQMIIFKKWRKICCKVFGKVFAKPIQCIVIYFSSL